MGGSRRASSPRGCAGPRPPRAVCNPRPGRCVTGFAELLKAAEAAAQPVCGTGEGSGDPAVPSRRPRASAPPHRGIGGALDWPGVVTCGGAQLTGVPSRDWAEGEGACPAARPWGPGRGSGSGAAMSRWPGPAGARRPSGAEAALSPGALDLNAEREKIRREIEELERSLEPGGAGIEMAVSDSSLSSGTAGRGIGPLRPPPVLLH